jgi:HK97 family phage major capsid protein
LQVGGWNPDLVVLHPNDWFGNERAVFAADSPISIAGDGQYVAGGGWAAPANGGLWGMRRALSVSLTPGTALVLDSSQVAVLDRGPAMVIVSREGHDNISKNLVTMLAEVRVGFAIFSPTAVKKVNVG